MERSSIRYAAVACVIAGGVLMSGSGAVALADPAAPGDGGGKDPGTSDGGTGAQTPEPATTTAGDSNDGPSVYKTATAGPVAVPAFQAPSRMAPLELPNSKTPSRWGPITLPGLSQLITATSSILSPGKNLTPPLADNSAPVKPPEPSPRTGAELPAATADLDGTPAQAPPPPTISFLPLIPKWIPTGPPVTIHNPLRDLLKLDLGEPFVPQLLPPPIVQILTAMSQDVPLVRFMMDDFGLDPLLSPYIVTPLLSDIVLPTLPPGGTSSMPGLERASDLQAPVMWTLPATGPPPADIALAGMDLPQAPPAPSPSPLPGPGVTNQAPQPHSAPPPPKGATPLSEPVAYRAGYSDYLRNAGMAQITSLALPGIAGILLVTAGGGFVGYRQARAGHVIRAEGIARFLR